MRVGAYQFAITNDLNTNFTIISKAIVEAANVGVKLLVFPECALSGYPPHDIVNSSQVNYDELDSIYERIQVLVNKTGVHVIVGTIIKDEDKYYNSAAVFGPHKEMMYYSKRALWGWDKENFCVGKNDGIFFVEGLKIGVRICFEVRFPEYFRELYCEHTDLNIIFFYDVADNDDLQRYELIKGHVRTRAVENVTHTLTVNNISPYQTAPTAFYDKSGRTLVELERNRELLLVYDLKKKELDFGELGRKEISNQLRTFL